MSVFEIKFSDCHQCVNFTRNPYLRGASICRECDSGEFFEERMSELRPERLQFNSNEVDDVADE